MYAVDSDSHLIRRDSDSAISRMVNAINYAFDQSIALRTNSELPPASMGHRGRRTDPVDELAEATAEYFA